MSTIRIHRQPDWNPNIPSAIINMSVRFGLSFEGTGGGCDFVVRRLDGCRMLVLMSIDGECPDMADKCNVFLAEDEQWTEGRNINEQQVGPVEAMSLMVKFNA